MSELFIIACVFLTAMLFSAVGNAGASGYLATMAFFGFTTEEMRCTAILLNIVAATITTLKFYRAGHLRWSLLWPFAVTSVPLAFVSGRLVVEPLLFRILAGIALLVAACSLLVKPAREKVKPPSVPLAMICGAAIGVLSGLTGIGGGVFLGPLLLFMGWANARNASGAASAFILVNSLATAIGLFKMGIQVPKQFSWWIGAVALGAFAGSELGSHYLQLKTLSRLLAIVLLIAAAKLLLA